MEVHVHLSNRSVANKILHLVDKENKHIINQTHAAILELIGRFPHAQGNFMDEDTMLRNLPGKKICLRTLRHYVKYMLCIEIIERGLTKDKKPTLRLKEPAEAPRENMAHFRKRIGVYSYHKKIKTNKLVVILNPQDIYCLPENILMEDALMANEDTKGINDDTFDAIFNNQTEENFSKTEENFSRSICGKLFQEKGKTFPALTDLYGNIERREEKLVRLDLKEKHHPIVPPPAIFEVENPVEKTEEKSVFLENDFLEELKMNEPIDEPKKQDDSSPLPNTPHLRLEGNSEAKTSEPMIVAKRGSKARKTSKERLIEATESYSNGHITNPIGKADTRGRVLHPSRAKSISDTGSVTIAQLWSGYLDIFEHSFGNRSDLENIMPSTREYVTSFFSLMRQKFLDYTGKTVDNRTLYEYLVWFHDPKRVGGMVGSKTSTNRGFVHPMQLMGSVTIKKFSDQHIGIRKDELLSDGVIKARKLTQFLIEAFDTIKDKYEDNFGLTHCLTMFGFVVVGEYLNDYHGWDGSRCKERMIGVLADFIVHSKNKENAKKFVAKAWESTRINKVIESSIWTTWEDCKNFVDLAIEKAERSNQHE